MDNRKKNALYSVMLIAVVGIVWLYRNYVAEPQQNTATISQTSQMMYIQGVTMGVVEYNIKYIGDNPKNYKAEVDSLLAAFNQSLSHYIPDSEISRFNKSKTGIALESRFFYPVMQVSEEAYKTTKGAFDPTVSPLINAWGFGPDKSLVLKEDTQIDSLLQLVGFDQITYAQDTISKTNPNVSLNFSAVAKGYAVDIVADLLEEKGIDNYMVEIGREVRCKGINEKGNTWRIGIVNPNYQSEPNQQLNATVALNGKALATSGNYESFYIKDGKKYAHTISPQTGYPVEHNLLSASVMANDCTTADAYATGLMVMGTEQAKTLLNANSNLEGILIYEEDGEVKTYVTDGLKEVVNQIM